MKVLDFFRKSKEYNFIKNNGLEDWWNNNFSERERKKIISESAYLLQNNSKKTAARTLYLLAGNVITKFYNQNPEVVINILNKAAELSDEPMELFEIHSQLIKLYSDRENEDEKNREKIIKLCQKQIDISEDVLKILKSKDHEAQNSSYPAHIGYQKLALIRFREGNKEKAVHLLKKAKKENWKGNWDQILAEFNSNGE